MTDPCDSGPCPLNTTCINQGNGYDCQCNEGFVYIKDQQSCMDIDECALNIANCSQNEICVNTIGSFKCICKEGFELINNRCQRIPSKIILFFNFKNKKISLVVGTRDNSLVNQSLISNEQGFLLPKQNQNLNILGSSFNSIRVFIFFFIFF